ncbi:MAG: T9SS type A sorting domain-containing protein, partial [Bacteroidales bacterium]|nr:T9SS type A sorting domain-containing protein [Bacteroidales bacterium]
IDAFEYGGGFSVIYHKGLGQTGSSSTVEAQGFDMEGNQIWSTQMCSNTYSKTGDQNSTGFHSGQNIVAWVNNDSGGLYGQNIGQNGEMGSVTPPTPPAPCDPPTNFEGEAYYNPDLNLTAAVFSWTAPETQPLHYNLYWEGLKDVIQIDGDVTSFYQEFDPGDYIFKLTAVYEDCESGFALTPNGNDYILIEIQNPTAVDETADEAIVSILKVYTMSGQAIRQTSLEGLSRGVYIVQGLTQDGKLVTRKTVVTSQL